jgi:hypothetical protein
MSNRSDHNPSERIASSNGDEPSLDHDLAEGRILANLRKITVDARSVALLCGRVSATAA